MGTRGGREGRVSCEKSSTEEVRSVKKKKKEKEAKLFGSRKTELSATMTNQLRALAGSNSVRRPRGFGEPVKGERKNSDVDCRSRRVLGLHLAANTR